MPAIQGITFETERLDRIIRLMTPEAEKLAQDVALAVAAAAKANTVRIDTGAMRRGWHASRLERFLWRVSAGVAYAIYHEFGTSKLAASPMLGPAVAAQREAFRRGVQRLFRP